MNFFSANIEENLQDEFVQEALTQVNIELYCTYRLNVLVF